MIKVVSHYCKGDDNFDEDYTSIEVYVDGELALKTGSGYHDDGQSKMEGFLEGLKYRNGESLPTLIENEQIADCEEC